jgi:AcrR family transcriptional regulator
MQSASTRIQTELWPRPDGGHTQATRERIVRAARELVVERGYAAVSTAEIMRRANVSRGGLYHHFASKRALLAAVVEAVEREFIVRLAAAVAGESDPFAALSRGSQWYLDECMRSIELQRAGLIEGRKALGWELWRETVSPYGLRMLAEALAEGMDAGQIGRADPLALAQLILAFLHEASAIILAAPDTRAERARTGQAVASLIDGLRAAP